MFHRGSTTLILVSALAILGCDSSSPSKSPPTSAKATEHKVTETAEQPKARDEKVKWTGGTMANATAVSLKDVVANPGSFQDKAIRVEGEVTRVCQGRGCWVEIADGDSSIIVKSIDHSIAFPKDGAKHRAVVEGMVRVEAEETCNGGGEGHGHHQQEEGEPAHECPQPKTLIEVRGAKLLAKAGE